MYTGMYHTHKLVVILFLLIYLVKGFLMLTNNPALEKVTKMIKVPEMIVSFLFLATGVYLVSVTSEISLFLIIKFVLVFASIPLAVAGFKKSKKPLVVLSLLCLVMSYGLAEMNRGRRGKRVALATEVSTDPNAANYDIQAHGKALYNVQCVVCHGEAGDKGLSGAKDLKVSKLKPEEVTSVIANGKNTMPAYSKTYNEAEIAAMTAYVLTLKD